LITGLTIFLTGLTYLKSGSISSCLPDEKTFKLAGLQYFFSIKDVYSDVNICTTILDDLWKKYGKNFSKKDYTTVTMYGPDYAAALYEILCLSLTKWNTAYKGNLRGCELQRICVALSRCANRIKRKKDDGKIEELYYFFDFDSGTYRSAPCGIPMTFDDVKVDTTAEKHSVTCAMAWYILSKCRGVRGADLKEKSALARFSYLGFIADLRMCEILYLATNFGRFCKGIDRFILWDIKSYMKTFLAALNIIIGPDTPVTVVGILLPDVRATLDSRHEGDSLDAAYYYPNSQIRVINSTPMTEFQRPPSKGDLVFDVRKLSQDQWSGMDKHYSYESALRAKHTSRMTEWLSARGRSIVGRVPILDYLLTVDDIKKREDEQNNAWSERQKFVAARKACLDISVAFNEHARWGCVTGLEVHNLTGWEFFWMSSSNVVWW